MLNPKTKKFFVEDEVTQRRLVRLQLEREGYEMIEAVNGREGVEKVL